jgi:hypothetical protein
MTGIEIKRAIRGTVGLLALAGLSASPVSAGAFGKVLTPEPAPVALAGVALIGVGVLVRRKRIRSRDW